MSTTYASLHTDMCKHVRAGDVDILQAVCITATYVTTCIAYHCGPATAATCLRATQYWQAHETVAIDLTDADTLPSHANPLPTLHTRLPAVAATAECIRGISSAGHGRHSPPSALTSKRVTTDVNIVPPTTYTSRPSRAAAEKDTPVSMGAVGCQVSVAGS